jgi:hypothetical protein
MSAPTIAERVVAERIAQGLPATVSDYQALTRLAAALLNSKSNGREAAGK